MINDIKLTSAMRNSLLNHQQIKDLTATVEKRLATGKKVNDILDGPVEYFKAKGLYDKADSLLKRKDDIDQAISTLKATQHGLTSGRAIIEQVKGLAEEARNASAAQRTILEAQANKLLGEYNNLIADTHMNGTNLLVEEDFVATFDGVNDHINVGDIGHSLTDLSNFTWVQTTDTSSYMTGHYEQGGNQRGFYLGLTASGELNVLISGDGTYGTSKNYETTVPINDGNWHHVGFTWDNGDLRLYVDGAEAAVVMNDDDPITSMHNPTVDMTIGALKPGGPFFEGSMSNTGLWNEALTPSEVATLYTSGAIPGSSLEGYWPLDEGNGTTAYDSSGNGNDGTIQNANLSDFWANTDAPTAGEYAEDLIVDFSDNTTHTIHSVDMRTFSLGIVGVDFSSAGLDATLDGLDAALNRIDSTAASFATDFALLQTRLEFTEDLINTHEEAGDKLTLADLEEESANRLALETREQLSIFSMTNSNRSIQNLIDILFGGRS